jgi:2-polyprenyl-3-methyl-5-hydroxy-6-metoxy-1,4-benzoquinol methylase
MVSVSETVSMGFATAQPVSSTPYLLEPVRRLAGRLSPDVRVLDAGCGNGHWAGLFASQGCEAVGIDASESGIAIARRTYPAARFEQMEIGADLLERLGERPFDLVVSTEVVEHLYNPAVFAEGCFRALRPGGSLIVSTPYHGWLKDVALASTGGLDRHHEALRPGGHIKFFSRRTLSALLAQAGFDDLRFVGAGRVPWLWKSMVLRGTRPTDGG